MFFYRFAQFFERWLSQHWQMLLLFVLGFYVPLLIFVWLATQIWKLEGGLDWDVSILMAVHATAQARLDAIAATLTDFATVWGVAPVSIVLPFVLLYQRRWRSLIYFMITMLGCGVINVVAKLLLHRVRPSLWDYPALSDFSFPSGHAMSSMILVAALVVLSWGSRWCSWIAALGSVFVIAIGWTRLYLGVHYPSDIVAGWMVAIAWAVGMSLVVKPHRVKSEPADGTIDNRLDQT
jgi:undecaprenyl-diphosphatase